MTLYVNSEPVEQGIIEQAFARIKSEAEIRLKVSCCERDPEFLRDAEEEAIDAILIAQEADQQAKHISEQEIDTHLEQLVKLYRKNGATWEMLDTQRSGLREEVIAELSMEKLFHNLSGGNLGVSDEEVETYYQEHLSDYTTGAKSNCLHLVKYFPEEQSLDVLYLKMLSIRDKAIANDNFSDIAKQETDKDDIELGWVTLTRTENPFESVLFSLKENEISPIISYENAFHIIQVIEHHPIKITPFEEIEADLRQRCLNEKKQQLLKQLAKKLRVDAKIERVEH